MIEYVLGFLFDEQGLNVSLIQKDHPEWQKGKFNGIGGKVWAEESPNDAMIREFREEAGVEIKDWKLFAKMVGEGYIVWCYKAFNEDVFGIKTKETEHVGLFPINELPYKRSMIFGLNWLIPLALDKDAQFTTIKY